MKKQLVEYNLDMKYHFFNHCKYHRVFHDYFPHTEYYQYDKGCHELFVYNAFKTQCSYEDTVMLIRNTNGDLYIADMSEIHYLYYNLAFGDF